MSYQVIKATSINLHFSLYLAIFLFLSFSLRPFVSLSFCFFFCLSLSLSLFPSLQSFIFPLLFYSVPVSLFPCTSLCLLLSLSFCLSLSLCLFPSLFLALFLFLSLQILLSLYLFADDDSFYHHSWKNNLVIAFRTLVEKLKNIHVDPALLL